jgi:hypothetical protein
MELCLLRLQRRGTRLLGGKVVPRASQPLAAAEPAQSGLRLHQEGVGDAQLIAQELPAAAGLPLSGVAVGCLERLHERIGKPLRECRIRVDKPDIDDIGARARGHLQPLQRLVDDDIAGGQREDSVAHRRLGRHGQRYRPQLHLFAVACGADRAP